MKKISVVCFFYFMMICSLVQAKQTHLLSLDFEKTTDNQLELVLFLTDVVDCTVFVLTKPGRLVIDLKNTSLPKGLSLPSDALLYFERIRTARRNAQDLRVVFDLKSVEQETIKLIANHSNEKGLYIRLLIKNEGSIKKHKPVNIVPAREERIVLSENEEVLEANDALFSDWEFSGSIGIEELGFFHNKLDSRQHNNYISGVIEPEIYREWDSGKQSFTFSPFYRYSQHDSRRTHFDIRELTWLLSEDDWELRVGFRKVFWGVAEGLHLVDIINQTDMIENTDTEDKLGQPMINLALIRDWGTIDLFVLPGFRERTFSGVEGRLRFFPEIDVGNALYEKKGIEKHLAFAVRWSHAIGDWDIGFSHFYGTSRDPSYKLNLSPEGEVELRPYYELINQTGLDVQLTYDDWIWKHEAIVRSGQGKTFYATTTGVEYTLFDLFSSGLDLGMVVEYMYDTRGSKNFLAPFQDDVLTALRFGFNDVQSTEILAGVMFDRTNNSKFYNIEASRRVGEGFTLDMEVRIFSGAPSVDPSYAFREDDHVRINLGYHF